MLRTRLTYTALAFLALIMPSLSRMPPAPQPGDAARSAPPQAHHITVDDLEPFMDEFFATQLARTHTPGAVVVVVQDGEVVLSKGYGLADVEQGLPMGPERTVMRLGSISKLFVATAVMQLVEQGRLDLHADVNRYLTAFQVDATYPEPITLAHLLTHTAGLDEAWDTSTDPTAAPPLGAYLAAGKLRRILPPGEAWYYTGVGYALAAHIVETVAQMPFDEYVAANILQPLGMTRSGYLLAPPLPAGLATGYVYQSGAYRPQPVDYWSDYPSSSLTATAADMARFMIAHLEGGSVGAARILRPDTVAQMQRQQYAPHPQLDGHTYGFVEAWVNGQRHIGHSGAVRGFGSILTLLPEQRVGYLLSFNQECHLTSACDMIGALRQQFADRYFPASPSEAPNPRPSTPLDSLTGVYRPVLYQLNPSYQKTVYKLTTLDHDVTVRSDGAGVLIDGVPYVEVAPLLFLCPANGKRIAFRQDDRGATSYLFRPTPHRRLFWHETGVFTRAAFRVWGALWAGVALVWPVTLLVRRRRGRPTAPRLERLAQGVLTLLGALNVLFLASLLRPFWISVTATRLWLTLPLMAVGFTVVALGLCGVMWRRRTGGRSWRIYCAVVVVASGLFVVTLDAWNLIGFRLSA